MQEGLSNLNVEVIQSTSDGGSAIKKYREAYLDDVNYSPDLFHIQHEIHKATAGPLASKQRKYEKALVKVQQQHSKNIKKKERLNNKSNNKCLDNKIKKVTKAIQETEATLDKVQNQLSKISHWKNRVSQAVAGISQLYHPYSIQSGQVQTVAEINDGLEKQFAEITAVAKDAYSVYFAKLFQLIPPAHSGKISPTNSGQYRQAIPVLSAKEFSLMPTPFQ